MFAEDLSALPSEELDEEVASLAAHIDAARCRLVELAAECGRRGEMGDGVTLAAWLGWRCALSGSEARQYERLAEALAELPLIRAAFASGRLSFAKVSTLLRVVCPDNEEALLDLAEVLTVSQLARAISGYRQLARSEAVAQQEREFFACRWAEDGSLSLRGRLAADDGAVLLRGLEAGRDALWQQCRPELEPADAARGGPPDGQSQRPANAEALVAMAELALAAPAAADRSGGERYQVVVHVDADTLAHDVEGRCALAEGVPLAVETGRRLTCDGSLVELLERDGEPLALGRKRRTVSAALRRALRNRDGCCRFPGCDRTRFVDAHHLDHWAAGGETNLENLILLCRRHHRLLHERGYTVRIDRDGEAVFRNQHGVRLANVPRSPPPSRPAALREQHRRRGLEIDGRTCRCGYGDRSSRADLVDAVIAAVRRGPAP